MHQNSADPIVTLSVGNVVSAAVTLYKSNFRDYLLLSMRSISWLLLAGIAVLPASGVGIVLSQVHPGLGAAGGVLLSLSCILFGLGKYMANQAMVSRLAYQQLVNRPETLGDVSRVLGNSQRQFLELLLWQALFSFLAAVLASLVLSICVACGAFISGQVSGAAGVFFAIIFSLIGAIGAVYIFLRYYASVFTAELTLAVESGAGSLESIGRSWQLVSPFVGRVMLVICVAFLITLPLTILFNSPIGVIYGDVLKNLEPAAFRDMIGAAQGMLFIIILTIPIVSTILSLLANLFVGPFWQAIKAVVYFDLRSRREGSDLGL
jgi:hypothetical protein